MKPKRSTVRVAVVSLLIAGMLLVEGAGAEDKEMLPRSSVLTGAEGGLVPVGAPRKLLKKSKASQDGGLSEETQSFLRALVLDKAVDLYRYSMQKSQSSANLGRELFEIPEDYKDYACNGCLALFEKGQPYSLDTDQQRENFCLGVVDLVTTKKEVCMNTDLNVKSTKSQLMCQTYRDFLTNYCSELMQCPFGILVTPTVECCQFNGLCLNK